MISGRMLVVAVLCVLCGCANRRVANAEYADPNVIEIVNDRFSESDLQLIAARMSKSLSEAPHFVKRQSPPRLVIANIVNQSGEVIDLDSLSDKIQTELFRTGRFELLDKKARLEIAKEYEYQQSDYVDPAKAKGPGKQYGADYILTGRLSAIQSQNGRDRVVYYKMTMTASDLSTGVVRWAEDKEIRKKLELSGISRSTSTKLKVAGFVGAGTMFVAGAGSFLIGLAHIRPSSFDFEHYPCPNPVTGEPGWECTRTVDIPARGPQPTFIWTGAALMVAAPLVAVLTGVLVPDGNPALDNVSFIATPNGGGVSVRGAF